MEVRILNQHSNWLCIIVTLSYPHAAHEGFRFRIPKFRFSSPSRQMRLWLRATDANLKWKNMVSDFQCRTWSLELHCTMDQRAQDFPWIFDTSNVISAPPLISFAVLFRWSRKKKHVCPIALYMPMRMRICIWDMERLEFFFFATMYAISCKITKEKGKIQRIMWQNTRKYYNIILPTFVFYKTTSTYLDYYPHPYWGFG